MIATDFAPNEIREDAQVALQLLATPWKWKNHELDPSLQPLLGAIFPKHLFTFFMSGRGAQWALLKAMSLPTYTEIIVVGFTCEAVVLPIRDLGYTVQFVDIDSTTYSVDKSDLKKRITANTRVLILQHTFGITPHRKAIIDLCKKHNIVVIEDLAHGFDESIFKNDSYITIKLLSFGRTKALSSVCGGAIATTDQTLHKAIQQEESALSYPSTSEVLKILIYKPLATFIKSTYDIGIGKLLHKVSMMLHFITRELSPKEKRGEFDPYLLKKYTYVQSVLLVTQLRRFTNTQKQRQKITLLYQTEFKSLPKEKATALSRFPYMLDSAESREVLLQKCRKQNIFLGKWYYYNQSQEGVCPQADNISRRLINLPTLITEAEATRIVNLVKSA